MGIFHGYVSLPECKHKMKNHHVTLSLAAARMPFLSSLALLGLDPFFFKCFDLSFASSHLQARLGFLSRFSLLGEKKTGATLKLKVALRNAEIRVKLKLQKLFSRETLQKDLEFLRIPPHKSKRSLQMEELNKHIFNSNVMCS